MISKTESGWVGYRKKYQVAGRVRVPAGHCSQDEIEFIQVIMMFKRFVVMMGREKMKI